MHTYLPVRCFFSFRVDRVVIRVTKWSFDKKGNSSCVIPRNEKKITHTNVSGSKMNIYVEKCIDTHIYNRKVHSSF